MIHDIEKRCENIEFFHQEDKIFVQHVTPMSLDITTICIILQVSGVLFSRVLMLS